MIILAAAFILNLATHSERTMLIKIKDEEFAMQGVHMLCDQSDAVIKETCAGSVASTKVRNN